MPPLRTIKSRHERDASGTFPRFPAGFLNLVNRVGFSLVELMVGITVLTVIVLMLSQMMLYSITAWRNIEANKERMQTERALTDFIGNELQSALLPINRPSQTDLQFVVNPTGVTASKYQNHDAAFWQMPLASDQTMGDVAEVGYFVQWDTITKPGNPRALLCRLYANPSDGGNYLIHTNPTAWISDALIKTLAPAVYTPGADSYLGLFAENVVGFWVQCLDSSGKVISLNAAGASFTGASFDSRQGYTDSTGVVKSKGALPVAIDLSLALLDSRIANRVGTSEKTAITTLQAKSTVLNANDFVTAAQSTTGFQKIWGGLRSYQTRIYLQGSK